MNIVILTVGTKLNRALAQCHEVLVHTVHHSYTWCTLL